jgi:hypothetical protein
MVCFCDIENNRMYDIPSNGNNPDDACYEVEQRLLRKLNITN